MAFELLQRGMDRYPGSRFLSQVQLVNQEDRTVYFVQESFPSLRYVTVATWWRQTMASHILVLGFALSGTSLGTRPVTLPVNLLDTGTFPSRFVPY
eukprot:494632-Rhodomonas_salina.1